MALCSLSIGTSSPPPSIRVRPSRALLLRPEIPCWPGRVAFLPPERPRASAPVRRIPTMALTTISTSGCSAEVQNGTVFPTVGIAPRQHPPETTVRVDGVRIGQGRPIPTVLRSRTARPALPASRRHSRPAAMRVNAKSVRVPVDHGQSTLSDRSGGSEDGNGLDPFAHPNHSQSRSRP